MKISLYRCLQVGSSLSHQMLAYKLVVYGLWASINWHNLDTFQAEKYSELLIEQVHHTAEDNPTGSPYWGCLFMVVAPPNARRGIPCCSDSSEQHGQGQSAYRSPWTSSFLIFHTSTSHTNTQTPHSHMHRISTTNVISLINLFSYLGSDLPPAILPFSTWGPNHLNSRNTHVTLIYSNTT